MKNRTAREWNIEELIQAPDPRDEKLLAVCNMLAREVEYFDWVGFYIANRAKRELILGPFVGARTEHVRIPFGRGICGQVAEQLTTIAVADISCESNYLSCNVNVRSEIVVPIFKKGQFVAELDIDSHVENPFSAKDKAELESLCRKLALLF
jgi:L-methionine (R)-S-oxide reductase